MQKLAYMTDLVINANDEIEAEEVVDTIARDMFSKLYECGRIIILPQKCKVGGYAYFIIEDLHDTYITVQKITDVSTKGFFVASSTKDEEESEYIAFSEIGKTVFLSLKKAMKLLYKKKFS